MFDLRKQKQSFFNSFCLPVVGPYSRMRKREKENLCGICVHYHKDEEGELCGIYGHRIRSNLRNLSFKLVPLHRKSCRSFCVFGSYANASRTELLKHLLVGKSCRSFYRQWWRWLLGNGGGNGWWVIRLGERERERERERDGWVGLEVVTASGGPMIFFQWGPLFQCSIFS
ncbi:putative protein-tyrosine-phosphatase [Helianthus debilis subsp. tardiflorus]